MPTFKNRAYFSVTSLVLNDVNVRDSNVIQPSLKESVLIRSYYTFGSLKTIEFENYECAIYGC